MMPVYWKNRLLRSKKILAAAAVVLIVVSVMIWLIISYNIKQSQPANLSSESGKLTINAVHKDMKLRSGAPISGSFKPEGGAQVFYAVATADSKMLGGGNILANSDHTFSRNMEFSADKNLGKPGKLTVYLQDQQGKKIDSVSVDVILE